MTGIAIKYVETLGSPGQPAREVTVTADGISPLGIQELLSFRPGRKVAMPLNLVNARVLDTNVDGLDIGSIGAIRCDLDSHYTSSVLALRPGGWLPAGFAIDERALLLLDRNVFRAIERRFRIGKEERSREPDFLDAFAQPGVSVSPLLYALESSARAQPTYAQAAGELENATRRLRDALPEANLAADDEDRLRGLMGLLDDTHAGVKRKQDFCQAVGPMLTGPVARRNLERVWLEILKAADKHEIRRNSPIVLAMLSIAIAPQGRSPARLLFNFGSGYTAERAYNGISDLRAIEIYAVLLAMEPELRVDLCTSDQPLAQFWVGMQASGFRIIDNIAVYDFKPGDVLLPNLPQDLWQAWQG